MRKKDSITGQYLSTAKFIALPDERRKPGKTASKFEGAKENNLQNINRRGIPNWTIYSSYRCEWFW